MKTSMDRRTTVLLDFNNQVWRNHFATERKMQPNSDGIHTGSVLGLMKVLRHAMKIASNNGTPKLVICEDRYPKRKHQLYKKYQDAFKDYDGYIKYKGNRDKKDLDYNPIELCQKYINCIPHTKFFLDGEEADDVIASYVMKHPTEDIFIYSSDRDLWPLHHRNIRVIFDSDGNTPTQEACLKRFETPDFRKIYLHKIIRGDSGDNVKGVKGYQFKKSIKAFDNCDGTLEDYFIKLYEMFGKNNPFLSKLFLPHNIRLMVLNQKVVRLKWNIDYEIQKITEPNTDEWKNLCMIFETPSLLNLKLMELF